MPVDCLPEEPGIPLIATTFPAPKAVPSGKVVGNR